MAKELEDYKLDFKQELPSNMTKIGKLISALSNEGGGAIIFGITDKGNLIGISNLKESSEKIVRFTRDTCKPIPKLRPLRVVDSKKLEYLIILIPNPRNFLIRFKKIYYKRIVDSTEKMPLNEVKNKEIYLKNIDTLYTAVWEKSIYLTPQDVLGPERGSLVGKFNDYYYGREIDAEIDDYLKQRLNNNAHKHILLMGKPLSGKSRLIYELLRKNDSTDVLIPNHVVFEDPNYIPSNWRKNSKKIVFLDDMDRFYQIPNFKQYLSSILKNQEITIIATCRSGKIFEELIEDSYKDRFNFDVLFEAFEIKQFDFELADTIIQKIGIKWRDIEYDGTIGSIFVPIKEMKRRFEKSTDLFEKKILESISIAYHLDLYIEKKGIPIDWFLKIAIRAFPSIVFKFSKLESSLRYLNSLELIKYEDDFIYSEEIYALNLFHYFKNKEFKLDNFIQLFRFDLEALFNIAYTIGDPDISPIRDKRKAIRLFRWIIFVSRLKKSLKYVNLSRINIASLYASIAYQLTNQMFYCKKAIKENYKALLYFSQDEFPNEYGTIQNNLGITYNLLLNQEKLDFNSKKAIQHLKNAKKSFQKNNNEYGKAKSDLNLSIVYLNLAEILKMEHYCLEALEVLQSVIGYFESNSIFEYSYEIASSYNNRGKAYGILAEFKNTAKFSSNAIKDYKKALRIFNEEIFPIHHSMVLLNIGIVYFILSKRIQGKTNSNLAITYLEKALEFVNYDYRPIDYANINELLGKVHLRISKLEDPLTNCEIAINYYKIALHYFKRTRIPIKFAQINYELANVYFYMLHIKEIINKKKYCKLAIKHYTRFLQIDFPINAFKQNAKNNIRIIKKLLEKDYT